MKTPPYSIIVLNKIFITELISQKELNVLFSRKFYLEDCEKNSDFWISSLSILSLVHYLHPDYIVRIWDCK